MINYLRQLRASLRYKLVKQEAQSVQKSDVAGFRDEFERFVLLSRKSPNYTRFSLDPDDWYPCLNDRTSTHAVDSHYINHTAWAARTIAALNPEHHVDIGSYLYFSTLISAYVPTTYLDYRPLERRLTNFKSRYADLKGLPFQSNTIKSLSCMHVVGHVGLGRYGDELDPDGDLKAMRELQRSLAVGGNLLFVTPIGKPRVCFNAHRIYCDQMISQAFDLCELVEFALIPDKPEAGNLIKWPDKHLLAQQRYGCGCFLFRKRKASPSLPLYE